MQKVLFFLHKIGPYHHARFTYLANDVDLTVVEIFPVSKEYDWIDVEEEKKYKVIKIEEHGLGKELKGGKLLSVVKKIIDNVLPELIIVTGWSNRTYFAALYLAKTKGLPIACVSDSTYGDSTRYWITEKLKATIIKSFDAFLVAGNRSKTYLHSLGIKQNLFSPWDVVDNDYFSERSAYFRDQHSRTDFNLPDNYILCISRFIQKKNIISLVKAFEIFTNRKPSSKLCLVLVGSGVERETIEYEIVSKGLQERIRIYPFAQYTNLPAYYAYAKAFILASTSDQWGLVVNEAMASSLPVIVSNKCGCVDDIVIDRENGFIIDPSYTSILNVLEELNSLDENSLMQMGRIGRTMIEKYNLNNFAKAIIEISSFLKTKSLKRVNPSQKSLITLYLYF